MKILSIEHTLVLMPAQEETINPLCPETKSSNSNLTDLSMGKTEASPAFSRLQIHLEWQADHISAVQ